MNKTVLITGASRGLGYELSKALATKGWQLIINARGKKALQKVTKELSRWTTVIGISGSITDEQHLVELTTAAKRLRGVDVVVNNASTLGVSPQPRLLDYSTETLQKIFLTNLIAPITLLQKVQPYLNENARIINLTSDAGLEVYPQWGGYGASKAALEHASATLALENPKWKVYWVDPGDMRTQMHQAAFPNEDISDRPLPITTVPGFLALIEGDLLSGRYISKEVEALVLV